MPETTQAPAQGPTPPGPEVAPNSGPGGLRPDGSRWDALSIAKASSKRDRIRLMEGGVAPDLGGLAGWEFAGTNTGFWAGLIGARKFKKGFYEGSDLHPGGPEPFIQGYNVPVKQNGVGKPHLAKPNDDHPRRFGYYRVHRVIPGAHMSRYENGLLLDYGLGKNPWYDPGALLRDYLVQVYADDPDLLLGHAFGVLPGIRLEVSFFVLERMNRHDYHGR
ncbi:MAG: hypothetical protein DRJ42_26160 [Deltaproteobacteria bacterium]|nr:MAG: hypothetical protein DRJ42_26160 [Deltaproteobacteria bacterium]